MIESPRHRRRICPGLSLRVAFASAVVAWLVSGCVAAVGAGTVAATDKTPIDHVVSLVSGKDCSIVRQQRGLTYCVEDEVTLPVRVHCYPTLGEATCYSQPDPFPGHQRPLGAEPSPAVGSR